MNATWMPHASLSQTSHVSVAVRSALTCLGELKQFKAKEWQVRATIHGMAGLPLVPVPSVTPMSPVTTLKASSAIDGNDPTKDWLPIVSNVTHVCKFDSLLNIPLRWRDLPRDAYIKFEILGQCDRVVSTKYFFPVHFLWKWNRCSSSFTSQHYEATVPLFNVYGKLQTGLMRLDLRSPQTGLVDKKGNLGLYPPPRGSYSSEWQEEDAVWKASRMLDQLERFEEVKVDPTARTGTNKTFGEIQPVPWLDKLAREYCQNTLHEAKDKAQVSSTAWQSDLRVLHI